MPQGGTAAHTHQPPQQTHTRTPSPKPTPAPAGSQAEMMELQRAAGNGAVSRMLAQRSTVPVLQRKACSCGGTCPRCREEAEKMQRKAARPGPVKVPPIVHDALHSPGQPLDAATLAFMQPRFGQDLRGVRIHDGATAAKSAQAVAAVAYTVGDDIVMNAGEYRPHSDAGKKLLAHELTHVIQQRQGMGGAPGASHEHEADATSDAVAGRGAAVNVAGAGGVGIARQGPGAGAPAGKGPTITPDIQKSLLEELQRVRLTEPFVKTNKKGVTTTTSATDPSSKMTRMHSNRTVAAAAIISPDGKVTYRSAFFDEGMGPHAEPQLLDKIVGDVHAGDTVAVAIDQVPCGPNRKNCNVALKQFREDPEHGSLRVYTVRSVRRDAPPGTTGASAQEHQLVSPKTAITRDMPKRFLKEDKEFTLVRLPIYKETKPAASEVAEAPKAGAPKPAAGTGEVPAVEGGPPATKAPVPAEEANAPAKPAMPAEATAPAAGAGKVAPIEENAPPAGKPPVVTETGAPPTVGAKGAGVASAGLQAFSAFMFLAGLLDNPAQQQALNQELQKALGEEKTLHRFQELQAEIDKAEGDIYYSIKFKVVYEGHESAKPSFPPLLFVNRIEILEVQISKEKLNDCGKVDHPERPSDAKPVYGGGWSWQATQTCTTSSQVQSGEQKEKERQRKAREQKQRELADRLRQLHPNPRPAPKAEPKPEGPPSLGVQAPQAPPQLLPGAPAEGPIGDATRWVAGAEAQGRFILRKGRVLEKRVMSGNPPSKEERQAFLKEEETWRTIVQYQQLHYVKESRSEAVAALKALLEDPAEAGLKLSAVREHLSF